MYVLPETKQRLDELEHRWGLSRSAVIARAVEQAHAGRVVEGEQS